MHESICLVLTKVSTVFSLFEVYLLTTRWRQITCHFDLSVYLQVFKVFPSHDIQSSAAWTRTWIDIMIFSQFMVQQIRVHRNLPEWEWNDLPLSVDWILSRNNIIGSCKAVYGLQCWNERENPTLRTSLCISQKLKVKSIYFHISNVTDFNWYRFQWRYSQNGCRSNRSTVVQTE